MEKSIGKFTRIWCAVVVGIVISCCQLARAGWSVNVNSTTGQGTVIVKVTSRTGVSNVVTTPFLAFPSAAINRQSNFVFTATGSLPAGADARTYVQVRGSNYFRTSIQSTNFNGDVGDSPNPDLLPFIIPRSACAGSDVEIIPLA